MNEIMKIRNLSKIYGKKEVRTTVLNNLSLDIEEGDFIAVMGPSGAGKSTLPKSCHTILTNCVMPPLPICVVRNSNSIPISRQEALLMYHATTMENAAEW